MFNIGRINFREMSKAEIESKISNPWFIKAHKLLINSVEIIQQCEEEDLESSESGDDAEIELPEGLEKEERKKWPDAFVLTASQDQDILLHRLSSGVKIGQFAQEQPWNIFDMTPYEGIRPHYVREWLNQKKQKWLKLIDDRIADHRAKGLLAEEESKMPPVRLSTKDRLKQMGININMSMSSGGNSLLGSDDMNPVGDNDDDLDDNFDLDHFESDDEDMAE